ncbi:hypothetical protein HN51_030923 [Arachis hypogaea]
MEINGGSILLFCKSCSSDSNKVLGESSKFLQGENITCLWFFWSINGKYELHFAILMAGSIIFTMNSCLNASMVSVPLEHSQAKILFVDYQLLEVAHSVLCFIAMDGAFLGAWQCNSKPIFVLGRIMDTSRSETDYSGVSNAFGRSMYMKNTPLSSNNMGGLNHITFKFIDRLLQHFKFITFKFIVLFGFMNGELWVILNYLQII